MGRTLVIGYGNPYRRDDGVAFHLINALRKSLGQKSLALEEDGQDDWGGPVDTLMQHQLLPELAPALADYERVVFVDAHVESCPDPVRVVTVVEHYRFHAVTHHVSPAMLLSLCHTSTGKVPTAWLLSVRGDDFDFGTELSTTCAARLPEGLHRLQELLPCKPD
jgi:hydrogenase maturation protease